MIDLRRQAVFIRDAEGFLDRTPEVVHCVPMGQRISVRFRNGRTYPYGVERCHVAYSRPVAISPESRVLVDSAVWSNVVGVWEFDGPDGLWRRVIYRARSGERFVTYPAARVEVVQGLERQPAVATCLAYWRAAAAQLPPDNPTRRAWEQLDFVHPESSLARYLSGEPAETTPPTITPIFPFRCNLSQRDAIDNALTHAVSVIEGPPGAGKIETILNLVATLVVEGGRSVGVTSLSNSAVDNVREKLTAEGFGFMVAGLGNQTNQEAFFSSQAARSQEVEALLSADHPAPAMDRFADVDRRLRAAQGGERRRAVLRAQVTAYQIERRHFTEFVSRREIPDLARLPLLRRSPERILEFLAQASLDGAGGAPGWRVRIRRYFRYGSPRGLDPTDADVVTGLQLAFYDRRIGELEAEIKGLDARLDGADLDGLTHEHRAISHQMLRAGLDRRYRSQPRTTHFQIKTYRQGSTFERFLHEYPVLLSTCHSLQRSLPAGYLLDYLVIDEASQGDLLAAVLAMASCRNLLVVGDQRQLPHISGDLGGLVAPAPAYDVQTHNILSSLHLLHAERLRVTLLREHYRCDPAIIGFCNKAYNDGELIPFTTPGSKRSMVVWTTVAGNHMRSHHRAGRFNQREIDAITQEVIQEHCADRDEADIGIATPYRLQVQKFSDALPEGTDVSTVHKFQGRQKPVIVLSTVLDESKHGNVGLRFVDDPKLVNVAVSRAADLFILVTNHGLMPRSRHIRDLIGYIRYLDPHQEVTRSNVVSVFDLLYKEYDQRLQALASRRRHELRYDSEDIILTVLRDLFTEEHYQHLDVATQVPLWHQVPSNVSLSDEEARFARRASLDFVVYNRITNEPLLAVEVDGYMFHENNDAQLARDARKNGIMSRIPIEFERLSTTGSGEEARLRVALDRAELRRMAGITPGPVV
jgi:AAA domain/Protein of unknown function (DUF2726)